MAHNQPYAAHYPVADLLSLGSAVFLVSAKDAKKTALVRSMGSTHQVAICDFIPGSVQVVAPRTPWLRLFS